MRLAVTTLIPAMLLASSASAELSFDPKPIATPPPQPLDSKVVNFTASNHVVLNDVIDGQTISKAMVDLASLKTAQPILFINSPGGDIDAGMNLVNMIISSPKEVVCIGYFAASMAFVTLQACHKRYVLNNSTLMQHQARFGARGYEENFKTFVAYIFNMLDKINGAQAKRMKMNIADFNKAREHDLWLYGEDSVKFKAADALVSATCTEDLVLEKRKQTVYTFFGDIDLVYSKCPLMTDPLEIDFKSVYSAEAKSKIFDFYLGAGASKRRQPIPMFGERNTPSGPMPDPTAAPTTSSSYYGR
jgi:ATP-dependent protease ClpP protease subunit